MHQTKVDFYLHDCLIKCYSYKHTLMRTNINDLWVIHMMPIFDVVYINGCSQLDISNIEVIWGYMVK